MNELFKVKSQIRTHQKIELLKLCKNKTLLQTKLVADSILFYKNINIHTNIIYIYIYICIYICKEKEGRKSIWSMGTEFQKRKVGLHNM